MGSIRLETLIAAPAGECFQLSLSVDAHTASMSGSGERAIGGVTSGVMKLEDTVTWRARHFGVVFRMTSAITTEPFPAWLCLANLQYVGGLGELPGAPGAAAEPD